MLRPRAPQSQMRLYEPEGFAAVHGGSFDRF
jgi:hypothetical protein